MSDAVLKQHAELLDNLACRTLVETYDIAEILRDPDLFASVWTEHAEFGDIKGRDNIRAASVDFFKKMEPITELRKSPAGWHVKVDGDTAEGIFYIVAQLKVPQPDGTIKILHSDAGYKVTFERTSDGWRIAKLGGIKDPSAFHDVDIQAQLIYEAVSFEV
jgi:hypothetical protein